MKRYLIIIGQFLKVSVARLVIYRSEFVSAMGTVLYWFILAVTSLSILTYQTELVNGWSRYQLFIVQGVYSILVGTYGGIFQKNLTLFMEEVWKGDYDYKLTKPLDAQFMASVGYFKLHAIARITAGILLILFSLHMIGTGIEFWQIGLFIALLLCSLTVMYSFCMMIALVSFWSPYLFNLSETIDNFISLGRYPLVILRVFGEFIIYALFPLVVMTTVPSQILIGVIEWPLVLGAVLLAVASFVAVRKLWSVSLRRYESASS